MQKTETQSFYVVGYFAYAQYDVLFIPYRHFVPLRLRGGRAPFVAIATFPPFHRGNLPRRRKQKEKNGAHRTRCAPFLSFKTSKHFFNGFYYVFYGKTEFFKQIGKRGGRTESGHSDNFSVQTYVFIPTIGRACFYRDSRSYSVR